jgi:hypothetical protein
MSGGRLEDLVNPLAITEEELRDLEQVCTRIERTPLLLKKWRTVWNDSTTKSEVYRDAQIEVYRDALRNDPARVVARLDPEQLECVSAKQLDSLLATVEEQ